ncbi:hypothetical protein OC844_008011, partial [Tilletia horrida]
MTTVSTQNHSVIPAYDLPMSKEMLDRVQKCVALLDTITALLSNIEPVPMTQPGLTLQELIKTGDYWKAINDHALALADDKTTLLLALQPIYDRLRYILDQAAEAKEVVVAMRQEKHRVKHHQRELANACTAVDDAEVDPTAGPTAFIADEQEPVTSDDSLSVAPAGTVDACLEEDRVIDLVTVADKRCTSDAQKLAAITEEYDEDEEDEDTDVEDAETASNSSTDSTTGPIADFDYFIIKESLATAKINTTVNEIMLCPPTDAEAKGQITSAGTANKTVRF